MLIIPPGKLHRLVIEDTSPYDRYVLWIYNSYLMNNEGINGFIHRIIRLTEEKNTHLVSFDTEEQSGIRELLDKALGSFISKDELSGDISESCIMMILDILGKKLQCSERAEYEQSDIIRSLFILMKILSPHPHLMNCHRSFLFPNITCLTDLRSIQRPRYITTFL